jgi:hypothetical protein
MKTAPAALLALSLAAAGGATAAPPIALPSVLRTLAANMKLKPGLHYDPGFDLPKGPYADVDAAMAGLKNAAEALKEAKKAYDDGQQSCLTKSYNSQEIQEACAPTDTVEACSHKLYAHCCSLALRKVKLAADALHAADAKLEKAISAVVAGATRR